MSNNVFEDIRHWAKDRNLITGATPQAQMVKLMEEVGELATALNRNDLHGIQDAIGDCVVVLTILADQMRYKTSQLISLESCTIDAYHMIKDRKGKMVDGIFVKEE